MVLIGSFVSAFWILSVNSWMHTPTGYAMNAHGQFISAGSWLAIIFNPSFPYRLAHTLSAAYLTTAFIVGGVGAWHLLKDRINPPNPPNPRTRLMFSMAMWMAAVVAPLQIALGALSLLARARGRFDEWQWLHRFASVMGPSGLVAVLAGWITTEVGRQPWTIHGLLRTADSVSPLAAPAVAASLLAFVVVYFAVFGA